MENITGLFNSLFGSVNTTTEELNQPSTDIPLEEVVVQNLENDSSVDQRDPSTSNKDLDKSSSPESSDDSDVNDKSLEKEVENPKSDPKTTSSKEEKSPPEQRSNLKDTSSSDEFFSVEDSDDSDDSDGLFGFHLVEHSEDSPNTKIKQWYKEWLANYAKEHPLIDIGQYPTELPSESADEVARYLQKQEASLDDSTLQKIVATQFEALLPKLALSKQEVLEQRKETISHPIEGGKKDLIAKQRNQLLTLCTDLTRDYAALLSLNKQQFGDVFLKSDRFSIQQDVSFKEKLIMDLRDKMEQEKIKITKILDLLQHAAVQFQSSISKEAIKNQNRQATTSLVSAALNTLSSLAAAGFGSWAIYSTHQEEVEKGKDKSDEPIGNSSQTHTITGAVDSGGQKSTFNADISAAVSSIAGTALIISTTGASVALAGTLINSFSGLVNAWWSRSEPVNAQQGAARLLVQLITDQKANVEKNIEAAYQHFERDTKLWINTLMDNAKRYQSDQQHRDNQYKQNQLLLEKKAKHQHQLKRDTQQLQTEVDHTDEKLEEVLGVKIANMIVDILEDPKSAIWKFEREEEIYTALLQLLADSPLKVDPKNISRTESRPIKQRIRQTLGIRELQQQQSNYKKEIQQLEQENKQLTGIPQLFLQEDKPAPPPPNEVIVNTVAMSDVQSTYLTQNSLKVVPISGDGRCLFGAIAAGLGKTTDALKSEVIDAILDTDSLDPKAYQEFQELLKFGNIGSLQEVEDPIKQREFMTNALLESNWAVDIYDKVPRLIAILLKLHLTILKVDGQTAIYKDGSTNVSILLYKEHYSSIQ